VDKIIKEISFDELKQEIIKFNNDININKLRRLYNEKTLLDILGVSRRELSHSYFLYWFFNPKETHGLNDFAICKLLEILFLSKFWLKYESEVSSNELITGNFEVESSKIIREYDLGKKGRVDLVIEIVVKYDERNEKIRFVIENKVLSSEGKDQTNRYFEYFCNQKDEFKNIFVYLNPISTLDLEELSLPECDNENFIQINYQSILDYMLEPALLQNISSDTRYLLEQYIQTLSQPTYLDDEDNYEKGLIMAIGTKERTLLENFWNVNKKIIMATLYAISSDPNQDKDLRDSVSEAIENINTNGRDRSRITIKFEDEIIASKIQKSDLGFETVRLLDRKGLIDLEVLEWIKNDTSCSFKLIKQKHEVRENEAKYKKYRIENDPEVIISGIEYYIARNWGINNIQRLISQMNDRFPKIKYEIIKTK